MILTTLHFISMLAGVAVAVSFYTLFERKVLGSSHLRLGPEVVGAWGLLQPFSDAIKLLTKEWSPPTHSNYMIYMWCPTIMLIISLIAWSVLPYPSLIFTFKYMLVVFFIITSISVYAHLGSGWSSNSNYAMIGSLRCITQTLSYEVTMGFTIMTVVILLSSLNMKSFSHTMYPCNMAVLMFPMVSGWWLCSMAETNRSPFDFGEGESELVSGFNVEYGSGWFTFMFLGEYASMIFMSTLIVCGFLTGETLSGNTLLTSGFFMLLYVWVRVSYPRTRYDKLMYLCWLVVLPGCLFYIIWCISISG